MRKLIWFFIFGVLASITYAETSPYVCVTPGLFGQTFGGANISGPITAEDFKLYNGSSCCGGASGGSYTSDDFWTDYGTTGYYTFTNYSAHHTKASHTSIGVWTVDNFTQADIDNWNAGNTSGDIRAQFSSSTNISYDSATGQFSYFGPTGSVDLSTYQTQAATATNITTHQNTFKHGNTTLEIFNVCNNNSFQPAGSYLGSTSSGWTNSTTMITARSSTPTNQTGNWSVCGSGICFHIDVFNSTTVKMYIG